MTITIEGKGTIELDFEDCYWKGISVADFKEMVGAGRKDDIILVRSHKHTIPNWHRLFLQEGDRIIIREKTNNG